MNSSAENVTEPEFQLAALVLGRGVIPTIAVFGLISNSLISLVVTKMGLKTPSLVYMLIVAIADSLSIIAELIVW